MAKLTSKIVKEWTKSEIFGENRKISLIIEKFHIERHLSNFFEIHNNQILCGHEKYENPTLCVQYSRVADARPTYHTVSRPRSSY